MKMSGCKWFWGVIYTIFFGCSCFSFYCSRIWGGRDTLVFAAMSFIAYLVGFAYVPHSVYLIHHSLRDKLDSIPSVLRILERVMFPLFSIYMSSVFEDAESMWCCICLMGSLLSLVMFYADPCDYGLFAFKGMCLGLIPLLPRFGKIAMLIIYGVSDSISQRWTLAR